MGKKLDLVGQRFGRLTVICENGRSKCGKVLWLCKCDCGNETVVRSDNLRSGYTTSCGCLQSERVAEVGKRNTESNLFPQKVVMFVCIDGLDCILVRGTCAVSAADIGVDPEDERTRTIPDDSILIYSDGDLLRDKSCERIRALRWVPVPWAEYDFSDDFYTKLFFSIMDFAKFADTHRVLQTVTPKGCIFQLCLYEWFAVSSEGIMYLSHSQIKAMWPSETLRNSFNLESDSDLSLSHALSTAVRKYCEKLDSRKDKAQARYQLLDRCALHEHYRNAERENVKNVAFFPYRTLKAIGLPAIPDLECAIGNGICGLRQ